MREDGYIKNETEKAILFEFVSNNCMWEFWIPKSKITIISRVESQASIDFPNWLMKGKSPKKRGSSNSAGLSHSIKNNLSSLAKEYKNRL
mgnify:CR=1 FL=1|tara:strand:+ start:215 stop:484 length:270 start_codon:yes stop_codon:yes gene_type:complete